jgi:hypothetical protein
MAARVLVAPVNFNSGALGSAFPVAPAAGVDAVGAGGTAFATAWPGTISGVEIPNNGEVLLYYVCGATAGGVCQVLVGELVGATGQVLPATAYQYTIAASSSGWLGPWSPATFNQQAPANVTYAGAINATALTSAAQGTVVVDFTTTTTLSVRAYQLIPIQP